VLSLTPCLAILKNVVRADRESANNDYQDAARGPNRRCGPVSNQSPAGERRTDRPCGERRFASNTSTTSHTAHHGPNRSARSSVTHAETATQSAARSLRSWSSPCAHTPLARGRSLSPAGGGAPWGGPRTPLRRTRRWESVCVLRPTLDVAEAAASTR
jgi:hypothetical protein